MDKKITEYWNQVEQEVMKGHQTQLDKVKKEGAVKDKEHETQEIAMEMKNKKIERLMQEAEVWREREESLLKEKKELSKQLEEMKQTVCDAQDEVRKEKSKAEVRQEPSDAVVRIASESPEVASK